MKNTGQLDPSSHPLDGVSTQENISQRQYGNDNPYYDSYIQNFWVDVKTGLCHVETLSIENGPKVYTFPITKRYDREALTQLLLAASQQYNSDYISMDNVNQVVTNAIGSIWLGMRTHGIRKLRPKEVVAA